MSDQSTGILPNSTPDQSKVTDDLKTLFSDTQELLRLTANASGEEIKAVRTRLESQLETAQAAFSNARLSVQSAVDNAEEYVRRNPWQVIGIGIGVGIGIGMLLGVLATR